MTWERGNWPAVRRRVQLCLGRLARVALAMLASVPFALGFLAGAGVSLALWLVAAGIAGYKSGRR